MGSPIDINARRYWRVAFQRKEESRLILEVANLPNASVYLAGYAVECILKAVLIVHTASPDRAELLRRFRGAAGHNIRKLRDDLRAINVRPPLDVADHLLFVSDWSTDLRYEPGPGNAEDAKRFLDAVDDVVSWADKRI